jgi:hypothetical protein
MSYPSIMDVAMLAYLLYLTVVISYSDVSLKEPFYVVLQALDVALVIGLIVRYSLLVTQDYSST